MTRSYGRTIEEIKADSIAKKLVAVLTAIEEFTGDPRLVLDSAIIDAVSAPQGTKEAVVALRAYYKGHDDEA